MLVVSVFIGADFVWRQHPAWLRHIPLDESGRNAIIWFAAVFLSLPMLIAAYRKLEALGLLLADLRVKQLASDARAKEIKAIISTTVPLARGGRLGGVDFSPLKRAAAAVLEISVIVLLVILGLA